MYLCLINRILFKWIYFSSVTPSLMIWRYRNWWHVIKITESIKSYIPYICAICFFRVCRGSKWVMNSLYDKNHLPGIAHLRIETPKNIWIATFCIPLNTLSMLSNDMSILYYKDENKSCILIHSLTSKRRPVVDLTYIFFATVIHIYLLFISDLFLFFALCT